MSRKFAITVEVEMNITDDKWDAELWMREILQKGMSSDAHRPVRLELHPFNPKVVSVVEVGKNDSGA